MIVPLFIFKYWRFFAGLLLGARTLAAGNFIPHVRIPPLRDGPLQGKTEAGNVGEYLAFILFFSDDGGGADQALPAISAQAAH